MKMVDPYWTNKEEFCKLQIRAFDADYDFSRGEIREEYQ